MLWGLNTINIDLLKLLSHVLWAFFTSRTEVSRLSQFIYLPFQKKSHSTSLENLQENIQKVFSFVLKVTSENPNLSGALGFCIAFFGEHCARVSVCIYSIQLWTELL